MDIPTEEIKKRFTNISGFATVSSYTGQVRFSLVCGSLWVCLVSECHWDPYTVNFFPSFSHDLNSVLKRFCNCYKIVLTNIFGILSQGIAALMNNLVEATLEQPYIGERVPEAWITLERFVLSKRSGSSLLQYSNVSQMAQSAGIYGSEV